jgi:hypothetical protein
MLFDILPEPFKLSAHANEIKENTWSNRYKEEKDQTLLNKLSNDRVMLWLLNNLVVKIKYSQNPWENILILRMSGAMWTKLSKRQEESGDQGKDSAEATQE